MVAVKKKPLVVWLGVGLVIFMLVLEWKMQWGLSSDYFYTICAAAPSKKKWSEFGSLGVPLCKSSGKVGWGRAELLAGLQEFVPVYEKRAIQKNQWGTRLDHSFGLWFVARQLQPELIIESGAFRGHSTWMLRQAMPNTPIISISPEHPKSHESDGEFYADSNCNYFTGSKFIDFGSLDWDSVLAKAGVTNKSRILIFFDDHQNHYKRIKQAMVAGFKHLMFDDNCDTGYGDQYSLRQICDQLGVPGGGHTCEMDSQEARTRSVRKRSYVRAVDMTELCNPQGAWWGVRGEMCDNFNRNNVPITHRQHVDHYRVVQSMLELYWEVPPVAGLKLTQQNGYDPARSVPPIIPDEEPELFLKVGLHRFDKWQFQEYIHMVYVRLSNEDD